MAWIPNSQPSTALATVKSRYSISHSSGCWPQLPSRYPQLQPIRRIMLTLSYFLPVSVIEPSSMITSTLLRQSYSISTRLMMHSSLKQRLTNLRYNLAMFVWHREETVRLALMMGLLHATLADCEDLGRSIVRRGRDQNSWFLLMVVAVPVVLVTGLKAGLRKESQSIDQGVILPDAVVG